MGNWHPRQIVGFVEDATCFDVRGEIPHILQFAGIDGIINSSIG